MSDSRGRQRLRGTLVVAQVAVSVVVLVAAGLFVRSVQSAQSVDLGFDHRQVLNMAVDVSQQGYDEARGRLFFTEMESRVRQLPGVVSVSYAYSVPLGYYNSSAAVEAEGQPIPQAQRRQSAHYNAVGADYFATLRVPVVHGRTFTRRDDQNAPKVAIVNEHMASHFWPGQDAIGKRFKMSGDREPWLEVVGISKQGKYNFIFEDPGDYFFVPIEQHYRAMRALQIRTAGSPDALAPIAQKEIRAIDADLPVYDVRSMTRALGGGNGFFLLQMGALFGGGLGLLGLTLALVGIYGVVSYSASQRTREIGVRMALGAQQRDILRLVVGHGLALVTIGIAIGVGAAFGVSRLLGGLLFGISSTDPLTFIGVPLALGAMAIAASYLPASRAARTDPSRALQVR
jgi:predicted permease